MTILEMRKEMGWPQSRVAFALGVDVGSVSRWERNIAVPHSRELKKMEKLHKHNRKKGAE